MACEPGPISIPSGAQQVHVAATASEVRVAPATVHAGDVYVVLDGPVQSTEFVQTKRTAEESPGPMSDRDLARLSDGDVQGTAIEGMSVGCCGNVFKVVLAPGKYAFLANDAASLPGRVIPPQSMAVLVVVP